MALKLNKLREPIQKSLKNVLQQGRDLFHRGQNLIPPHWIDPVREKLPFLKKEREEGTPGEIERRQDLRVPLKVVRVWREEEGRRSFLGYARDISLGGLFIQMVEPLQQGEHLQLLFQLIEGEAEIRCEAEVVWARRFSPRSKLEAGIGVHFVNLSERDATEIQSWIDRSHH